MSKRSAQAISANSNSLLQNLSALSGNYNKGKWSPEEDANLRKGVALYGEKCWKEIATLVPGRSSVQCFHRWNKTLRPGIIKGAWTQEEKDLLKQWVDKNGPYRWSKCAEMIPGRNGKQCREHWLNHMGSNIKKGDWTIEEDAIIFECYKTYGKKWSQMTERLPGRTENSIKNRFYAAYRRLALLREKEAVANESTSTQQSQKKAKSTKSHEKASKMERNTSNLSHEREVSSTLSDFSTHSHANSKYSQQQCQNFVSPQPAEDHLPVELPSTDVPNYTYAIPRISNQNDMRFKYQEFNSAHHRNLVGNEDNGPSSYIPYDNNDVSPIFGDWKKDVAAFPGHNGGDCDNGVFENLSSKKKVFSEPQRYSSSMCFERSNAMSLSNLALMVNVWSQQHQQIRNPFGLLDDKVEQPAYMENYLNEGAHATQDLRGYNYPAVNNNSNESLRFNQPFNAHESVMFLPNYQSQDQGYLGYQSLDDSFLGM